MGSRWKRNPRRSLLDLRDLISTPVDEQEAITICTIIHTQVRVTTNVSFETSCSYNLRNPSCLSHQSLLSPSGPSRGISLYRGGRSTVRPPSSGLATNRPPSVIRLYVVVESSSGISRLERSIVLRLVAAVSRAGLVGDTGPSGKPFDTLRVG
jgi:hypothetical protein